MKENLRKAIETEEPLGVKNNVSTAIGCLVALTVLFSTDAVSQTPRNGRWTVLEQDSVHQLSIDRRSVVRNKNFRSFWLQEMTRKPDSVQGQPVLRKLMRYALDCKDRTIFVKAAISYGLGGVVLGSDQFTSDSTHPSRPIVPESTGEDLARMLCPGG
jgi:hypothetical protein